MQSYGELETIILKIKSCFLRKVMIMSHNIVQDYKILKYECRQHSETVRISVAVAP